MTCQARIDGDGPLVCQRTDPHEPHHGCTYAASAGDHSKPSEPTGHKQ